MTLSSRSMALITLVCLLVALNAQTTDGIPCLLDNVDLVFVLDSSWSIKPDDFATALTGLTYFVSGLKSIGPGVGQSRVGIVSFSDTGRVELGLNWWSTVDQVNAAILNVTQTKVGTNIADGMRVAREEVYGSTQPNGHARLMLVITDGQDDSNVITEGYALYNENVTVYAIGIGEDINTTELVRVAGSASRVIVLTSWLSLTSVWGKACAGVDSSATAIYDPTETFQPPTPSPATTTTTTTSAFRRIVGDTLPSSTHLSTECPADSSVWPWLFLDILFVVDTSAGVSKDGLGVLKAVLYAVISRLSVGQSSSQTRVGLLRFGNKTELVYDFTVFNTTDDAVNSLRGFLDNETNFNDATANLADGINDAAGYIGRAGRNGFGQVMVVLSSQGVNCSDAANEGAKECQYAAVFMSGAHREIFSIAIESANQQQSIVVNLGNPLCTIFNGSDPNLQSQLLTQLSYANCFCKGADYVQVRSANTTDCRRYAECVWIEDASVTEAAAEFSCDDTLVIVHDQEKQTFLNYLDDPFANKTWYPYWIGLKGVYPNLQWQDGTPLSNDDYTNWAIQPAPGQQTCVWMQPNGLNRVPKWYPQNCSQTAYFICQKPACSPNNVACS